MDEFFSGWRRKTGCVTLVLACVFATGWIRSLSTTDFFHCVSQEGSASDLGLSIGGYLGWEYWYDLPRPALRIPKWVSSDPMPIHRLAEDHDMTWRVKCWGIEIGTVAGDTEFVFVWYGWIVVPLTLLSAYLLLSKPRPKKPSASL